MEFIFYFFQIFGLVLFIGCIIWMVFSDKEKNKYNKINFKNKKEYLCVYYLYGNKDLKSNIGVLSKKGETYLLETEDKVAVHNFTFQKEEIKFVEMKERTGIGMEDTIVGYNYDYSKSYFSGRGTGTFETEKGIKVSNIYEIKITLNNGIILVLESKKNPSNFFKDIK